MDGTLWPRLWLALLCSVLLPACAYVDQSDGTDLGLSAIDSDDFVKTAAQPLSGQASFGVAATEGKVVWMACAGKSSKASVVLFHDEAPFAESGFCQGWLAQAFLSQSLDVVAVNRPGYGLSKGVNDYWGPLAIGAVATALDQVRKSHPGIKPMQGVYGYGSGASAALAFARRRPDFQWAIIGGGWYDLDESDKLSKDVTLKKLLAGMRQLGGERVVEERSVGYDVSGLPRRLAIYHGKQDSAAPIKQAQVFADSLTSARYQVTLQLLEGATHDLKWPQHRRLLEVLAKAMAGGS